MQVFFNPAIGICNVLSSANPGSGDQGLLNQATLFHEALHGFTGDEDVTLQAAFGLATLVPSVNITYYLMNNVFPGGPAANASRKAAARTWRTLTIFSASTPKWPKCSRAWAKAV